MLALVLMLFLLTIFALVSSNCDPMAPFPLVCESFLLTSLIALSNVIGTPVDISFGTSLFIVSVLAAFALSFFFGSAYGTTIAGKQYSNYVVILRLPKKKITFIYLIFCVFILYLGIQNAISTALSVSVNADYSNMMEYNRAASVHGTIESRNMALTLVSFFVQVSGYFYSYLLIQKIVIGEEKVGTSLLQSKLEMIVILVSLLISALGSGRTFMLQYICFVFIAAYYLNIFKSKRTRLGLNRLFSVIKRMFVAFVIFFAVFQTLGLLTGKTGKSSWDEMLFGYSGAAIIALDRSLEVYKPDNRFFGEETFFGFYGLLNACGISVPNDIHFLPFVSVGKGKSTNIYTALRTYYYDFGLVGVYIIECLIGFFAGIAYHLLRIWGGHPIYLMLYSFLIYGIAMQGIGEYLIRFVLSISQLVYIIIFSLLVLLYGKRTLFAQYEHRSVR